MPTGTITLGNISQSVFRPMIIDVVQQVMGVTKISDDTTIYLGNEAGELAAAGSTVGEAGDRRARFDGHRRVLIKADESYHEDLNVTDTVGRRDNHPIINDPATGLFIYPTFATSQVTIDFTFETKSKEEARRWMDDINMRYKMLRISPEHQLTYCYTLPRPTWSLVEAFFNARENKAPYDQLFGEYLMSIMTDRVTVIGNENGKHRQFAVTERRRRVQGYFNFTPANIPKPELDQARGVWSIQFQYSFSYQRPCGVEMSYPIIVHNQLLPDKFIEFVNHEPKTEPRVGYNMSQTAWAARQFESNVMGAYLRPAMPYIRIPAEDDYVISTTFPGTGTYMLVLLAMADQDDKSFNLRELGDVMIDHDILEFMESEYKYIGIPSKSILHVDVYRDKMPLQFPSVKIDKDLNVTMLTVPDLRKQYRLRFSVFTDLSMIDRPALDRLRCFPKAFVKIIGAINELLFSRVDFQHLGDQRQIHPWQLSRAYEIITGCPITNGYHGPTAASYRCPPGQSSFLDIPPHVVKRHRDSRRGTMTVQVQNLTAHRK